MLRAIWYTEQEGGIRADGSADLVPDHDFALYARSEIVGYHLVTFDPGDGELSVYEESTEHAGMIQIIRSSTPSRKPSILSPKRHPLQIRMRSMSGTMC